MRTAKAEQKQNIAGKTNMPDKFIRIKGAREHNLKNISVDIPKNKLTVITGLSGSGKSSLAFDTLYAEGHRRFVESLSAYARQFLDVGGKPDVDSIEGLSPAIAIEQKTTSRNPRSTVGTVTEIYDYLRVLYAQAGTPYCPNHHKPITSQTISQMVDHVLEWPEGTRLMILAPVVRGRKGEYKKDIQQWQRQGFTRIRINGDMMDIADAPNLDKKSKHDIEVVVDRLVIKPDIQQRLADSIQTGLKLAEGLIIVEPSGEAATGLEPRIFSEKHACPICGFTLSEIEPRLFSFNSPFGACKSCDGLGELPFFNPDLIVPDHDKSLLDGAIRPWGEEMNSLITDTIESLAHHFKVPSNTPWKKLPDRMKEVILHGSGDEKIKVAFHQKLHKVEKPFEGVVPQLEKAWDRAGPAKRYSLSRFRGTYTCPDCNGARLSPEALTVKIDKHSIAQMTALSIKDATAYFKTLHPKLGQRQQAIAAPIIKEVSTRLGFLSHVGLGYLTLDRVSGTLSGGEAQRIRLASQIGSGLTGVMYVLDEPSIGLHPRDNSKLLEMLKKLRDLDNTVIVVEHDEETIREADCLIDIGPGAGKLGGKLMAIGTADSIAKDKNSITGQFLAGKRSIALPAKRRPVDKNKALTVVGASGNNLKNVTVDFPVGVMTCVTGVSGGGKSTLVMETLSAALERKINGAQTIPEPHKDIKGLEHFDKAVNIDQSPIGRTPRSNPATYTGVMDPIRNWFAGLPEARARGYTNSRFSFNVKGGRCEACEGDGLVKVEMHFLPDVYVPCEVCHAKRFNRETLEVKFKGKSIADVLEMDVATADEFFQDVPPIHNKLKVLLDVGLSYIKIGQSATTLSGGEAQRIKLAKELSKRATGRTISILDEPTTGLHFADVELLLKVLHRLVDDGNTMVIIEHNLDVMKTADWIIDVGPEGGDQGGQIIATGTPEDVAKVKASYTGQFLAPLLKPKKTKAA